MPSIPELMARRAELDQEIIKAQREQRAGAIAQIKSLMAEHGLTATDLSPAKGKKPGAPRGAKVAAKYRNKATGDSWSGRGLQPRWLKAALAAGKKLSDFAV
jgi:DNA-binding protein H-NS